MSPLEFLGLVMLLLRGGRGGPQWPEPTPPAPSPPGAPPGVPPAPPPGAPPVAPPVAPPSAPPQTTWKPYFYIQPDAGEKLGTPYALAGAWHGQGSHWTDLYNYTRGRRLGDVPAGSTDYAWKGDQLLVPYYWPEPRDPAIAGRCKPIPAGTTLPEATYSETAHITPPHIVHGDDEPSTI